MLLPYSHSSNRKISIKITPVQVPEVCGIISLLMKNYAGLRARIVYMKALVLVASGLFVYLISFFCSFSICLILFDGVGKSSGIVPPKSFMV